MKRRSHQATERAPSPLLPSIAPSLPVSDRRRRWLCIAYAFAPINRSGTHRTLGFVKHLDQLGWDATVVTVEPDGEPIDLDLLRQVPSSTRIIRTSWTPLVGRLKQALGIGQWAMESGNGHWSIGISPPTADPSAQCPVSNGCSPVPVGRRQLREWLSRLLMTPDSRIGWIASAVSAAMRAVRRRRPDIIYSTAPYMSAHLIAMIVGCRTGIPWVADFRDPWRDNPFRDLGFKSLERWDAWLEARVLRRATHVVCNTTTYERRLCERFPYLAARCSTILNGFDSEVFRALKPATISGGGAFVFAHCGQFYGPRSPIPYLTALRRVRDRVPDSTRKPQLLLIGPDDYQGRSLAELARNLGVADGVRILGAMPHLPALAHLAGSSALLLAGSCGAGGDLQLPGKLFEYLALRKPILAGVTPSNPVVDILREAGAPARICRPDDPDAIAQEMLTMTTACHREEADAVEFGPPHALAQFDRARRAGELVALFNHLVANDRSHAARVLKCATAARQESPTKTRPKRHSAQRTHRLRSGAGLGDQSSMTSRV